MRNLLFDQVTRKWKLFWLPILVGIASLLLPLEALYADATLRAEIADGRHVSQFRQAGLRADRSKIPDMVRLLKSQHDPGYDTTLLHSLALLGATDALPVIDQMIHDKKSVALLHYLIVERARLVAEDAARTLPAAARPGAASAHLLSELGLTADGINGAVTIYNASFAAWKASLPPDDSLPPPAPVELFALREMADIAYRGGHIPQPEANGIDFSLDDGASIKAGLAPLTRQARIGTLVQELTFDPATSIQDDYRQQLLVDEGAAAHEAIKARLQDMAQNSNHYASTSRYAYGYAYLNNVLDNTPDVIMPERNSQGTKSTASKQEAEFYQVQFVPGY